MEFLSRIKKKKVLHYYTSWLEKSISKGSFHYYKYSEFENVTNIVRGGFGTVYRAKWKCADHIFILKSFHVYNNISRETINEVLLFN